MPVKKSKEFEQNMIDMPNTPKKRGRKPKIKSDETIQTPIVEETKQDETAQTRKSYPSREERLKAANADIERWEKLNSERRELVEKTRIALEKREAKLTKGERILERVIAKRDRIQASIENPNGAKKKTNEIQELYQVLKAKGLEIADVISRYKQD